MSYEDILSIVFGSALAIVFVCLAIICTIYAIKVGLKIDQLRKEKLELQVKDLKLTIKLHENAVEWNEKHKNDFLEVEDVE